MNKSNVVVVVLAVGLAFAGCDKAKSDQKKGKPVAAERGQRPGAGGAAAKQPNQKPALSLKMVMRELANTMARVMGGLWMESWPVVASQAQAIADHSLIDAKDLARIKKILGKDMAAFVAQDKLVHDTALRLSKIAPEGKVDAIMTQLVALQRGCVGCHTKFRKRIRPKP